MKAIVITTMVALAAAPISASAAELDQAAFHDHQGRAAIGTFAGARVRLTLGASPQAERLRAGVTFAGARVRAGAVTEIGEGAAFELTERRGAALSLAGYRLTPGKAHAARAVQDDEAEDDDGPSTSLLIVGGVVLALGIGAAVFYTAARNASD